MAGANLPAKKYKKTTPTITRLSFECSGSATKFVDVGRALSTLNRRFYRAGLYYYINSVEVYNNEAGVVDLHTLPDSYVTKNAWNRGFQLFQKMNSMVDAPLSNIGRPKYHDFKVYMSDLHRTTGSLDPALHGINAAAANITPDEWAYSQFVSADDDGDANQQADNFNVHMLGPHSGSSDNWDSVGLIISYRDTRSYPDPTGSPVLLSSSDEDPLVNVFDMSSEEQMNDIIDALDRDNDETPYDSNALVGQSINNMQHVARIGTEQGINRIGRAAGFCAPFGLICIDPQNVDSTYRIVFNLAVGTYHGVYAERA
jgi:hypothetical protein